MPKTIEPAAAPKLWVGRRVMSLEPPRTGEVVDVCPPMSRKESVNKSDVVISWHDCARSIECGEDFYEHESGCLELRRGL